MTGPLTAYAESEARDRLARTLPAWTVGGGRIRRIYRTRSWRVSLMVANAIGHLAEAAWHHPDLVVAYGRVEVHLSTHDAGGVTDRDFELAERIEAVVMWQPGTAGGALEGPPREDPRFAYVDYGA